MVAGSESDASGRAGRFVVADGAAEISLDVPNGEVPEWLESVGVTQPVVGGAFVCKYGSVSWLGKAHGGVGDSIELKRRAEGTTAVDGVWVRFGS